jgi:ferredoxin-NADP reductase
MSADEVEAIKVVVSERDIVADGVARVELRSPEGADLPEWSPGAHIDVHLPAMIRQYSLCGDPRERDRYVIAILKQPDGRGGSRYMHDRLEVGTTLTISAPRNHFELVDAPGYCFVAGGIGITPILPMINAAISQNRPWKLVYGGRNTESMAFRELLSEHGPAVDIAPEDQFGQLDLRSIVDHLPPEHVLYCCGPEGLLAAIERTVPAEELERLHLERFAKAGEVHKPDDVAFTVECQESGCKVLVPAGVTILDALIGAGVDASFDCREGTCGTCELDVLDGVPDHRDSILSPHERKVATIIFPCVSRAKTAELVLDV